MHRIIVIGLGPIGLACAQAIARSSSMQLAGLVDNDPNKQGKAWAQLGPGDGANSSDQALRVADNLASLPAAADTAIVTTGSSFSDIAPLLRQLLDRKLHGVSSCEQMSWPWYRHDALAEQIDAEAKMAQCALLGTGVNPGFVMELLAVSLSSMACGVNRVRCVRRVDASLRREPLQKKVGATLSVQRFRQLQQQQRIGHQGLCESAALLAAGLSRHVEPGSVHETLEPVIAEAPIQSALGAIQPGEVAGIHNMAKWNGEGLQIELDLTMAVGLTNPQDKIVIEGPATLQLDIKSALPGDSATVAALVNQIPNLSRVQSGLRTMLDMPPAGCVMRD